MQIPGDNPWVVLGLAEGATQGEARRAFRRLVKETHPDAGGDARAFAAVFSAYSELCGTLPPDPPPPPPPAPVRQESPYDRVLRPVPLHRTWSEPRRVPLPSRRDFATVLEAELARMAVAA